MPNLLAYDPAFSFEIAVIVEDGIRRMYKEQEDIFYYLTLGNEKYPMPRMPVGSRESILRGMYCFRKSEKKKPKLRAHLFGSGAIMNEVLGAQTLLEDQFHVATDVWSVTSYKELHRDGLDTDRFNMLHPSKKPRRSYVGRTLGNKSGVFVAVSDYVKALPHSVAQWFPRPLTVLGTDGFGRSDGREALRDFFEVDAKHIVLATLWALAQEDRISMDRLKQAMRELRIRPEKINPMTA